jgi:putative zinc finger protein
MDCKAFAKRHPAFIDDTLPGVEMAAVREHLSDCARCARRDAEVRRALLVLKNLPAIEVSEGFQDRLHARLSAEESAPPARASADRGFVKWAAAAALLIAVVGVGTWPESAARKNEPSRLPAVFASLPATEDGSAEASMPAYMASMSTGIPMWPALMLAEEGPLRFAASEVARHHD